MPPPPSMNSLSSPVAAGSNSGASPPTTNSRFRIRGFSTRSNSHGHSSGPSSPVTSSPTEGIFTSQLQSTQSNPLQRSVTGPVSSNQPYNSTGWLPTVGGVSGLSRVPTAPAAESSVAHGGFNSTPHAQPDGSSPLVRSASDPPSAVRSIEEALLAENSSPSPSGALVTGSNGPPSSPSPSIRFVPHIDLRPSRPSLTFPPIERVLRHTGEVIKVGRYSDRDAGNPVPVGFKSKVVSRRHCEFWSDNGQWYVKDVKSSSGTFLNHVRLSSPGVESKAFPLYDGDVLQLGIDFKGGEETIFRCVKIRVELNRTWQKGLNNFNIQTHKKLQNLGKDTTKENDTDAASSECAICLMHIAPCQSLFVAPCSHVWHYKCVRPIILNSYPTFLCPNCRAVHDLEREIEDDDEQVWEVVEEESHVTDSTPHNPGAIHTQSDPDDDNMVHVDASTSIGMGFANHPPRNSYLPDINDEESNDLLASLITRDMTNFHIDDREGTTPINVSNSVSGATMLMQPWTVRARGLGVETAAADPAPDVHETSAGNVPYVIPRRRPGFAQGDGTSSSTSQAGMNISLPPNPLSNSADADHQPNPDILTPRNNMGPFVLNQ